MLNKVMLIGNLGADPEVRNTNSGSVVANLRVATSSRRKDRDGNWSDQTEWHRVVCFGRTAEFAQNYFHKGKMIYVEGNIRTNKWQDRDGNDRYTTEVVAREIQFVGAKNESGGDRPSYDGGGNRGGSGSYRAAPAPPAPPTGGGAPDDDIPF